MRKFSSIVLASALLVGTSAFAASIATLESVKGTPASLDASDGVWAKAKEITIPLGEMPYKPDGYKGMTKTNVVLKSLYDDKNIYIKAQYDDPTMSLARLPWEKQADGKWKQLKKPDQTGHENDYYEDKMGFFWDINTKGFEKKGCAIACHMAKDGMNNGFADKAPGRKYTNKEGETIDMWHWMGVRSNPMNQTTDQFVDNTADPKLNANFGRKSDEIQSGGFKDNVNADKSAPAFMNKDPKKNGLGWIVDGEKVPFVDTFKAGDRIGAMITNTMVGSRGDIATNAVWKDGKWTLVFQRALVTTHPKSATQDVQFADLKKPYFFGVSVFDNSAIDHMYHDGAIALKFK